MKSKFLLPLRECDFMCSSAYRTLRGPKRPEKLAAWIVIYGNDECPSVTRLMLYRRSQNYSPFQRADFARSVRSGILSLSLSLSLSFGFFLDCRLQSGQLPQPAYLSEDSELHFLVASAKFDVISAIPFFLFTVFRVYAGRRGGVWVYLALVSVKMAEYETRVGCGSDADDYAGNGDEDQLNRALVACHMRFMSEHLLFAQLSFCTCCISCSNLIAKHAELAACLSLWFQDWNSERSPISEVEEYSGKFRRTIGSVSGGIQRYFKRGSDRIKSFRFHSLGNSSAKDFSSKKILDPQGAFLQRWNKIFVLSCVIAVSIDPLFFYIPVVDGGRRCLDLDHRLEIIASVLRSFTDAFYVLHIFFQFRTGFIAPHSRVFGRGILVEDSLAIARRYLSSYFLIDVLAVLPLPQVIILFIIPKLRGSAPLNAKNALRFVILLQYIPRLFRILPLYREVTRTSGIFAETAWAGAALNLFLYMLASHVGLIAQMCEMDKLMLFQVTGALWYLFSIERQDTCWRRACKRNDGCIIEFLYCQRKHTGSNAFLDDPCPIEEQKNGTAPFDFGIYLPALNSKIVQSKDFPQKFFYCFWWGLQNLSSLGQNLDTSTFAGEISFAVLISICGLVLFALLIGNMQTYLQSTTVRLEEMRLKRRDAEQWMSHRLLPENLRERIRRYEQYKWQETRGVDEENLVRNLPKDLRRDIKRHLCLALLTRVPMFEKMDDQLLDAMCDCLKPALYTEDSYIIREGDPVDEMLFIMRGKLETVTTNGGRTGFFNSDFLKAGDFCGEELLTWALDPHSSSNLPSSTRTVRTLKEVEGFALVADDLKFVASQFRRLHSKQLRHTFRFYSQQWRTWAACFIQAAWRRYCRKKLEETLFQEEDKLQAALARGAGSSSPSLGATIYASRFAANALRALRRNGARKTRLPDRLPPMLLQKPAEPDFTAE
ncbi:Cyclic nucleotide-gated ion channel 1 [Asimina triloba]